MRVRQVGDELHIVLPAAAIEALSITPGTLLEVTPPAPPEHHYASLAEGIAAFDRTEPLHRNTYRELAK